MIPSPSAPLTEVEGTVFQTILQELETKSNQLENVSTRIYGSVNRIWDNRIPDSDEKEQPMPSDIVGLIYYYVRRMEKSTHTLFTTADLLDKMV